MSYSTVSETLKRIRRTTAPEEKKVRYDDIQKKLYDFAQTSTMTMTSFEQNIVIPKTIEVGVLTSWYQVIKDAILEVNNIEDSNLRYAAVGFHNLIPCTCPPHTPCAHHAYFKLEIQEKSYSVTATAPCDIPCDSQALLWDKYCLPDTITRTVITNEFDETALECRFKSRADAKRVYDKLLVDGPIEIFPGVSRFTNVDLCEEWDTIEKKEEEEEDDEDEE